MYDFKFWLPIIVSVIIAIVSLILMIIQNKKNNNIIAKFHSEDKSLTIKNTEDNNFIARVKEYLGKFERLEQEYINYTSNISKINNKIYNLETYKTKFLLSKIFNVDITFQSIDDELLLNNIIEEIKKPETEIDHLLLGLTFLRRYKINHSDSNAEKAEKNINEAINKSISHNIDKKLTSECYNYLGVLYDEKEKYNKAIEEYNLSKKENPHNPKPYYNLACTYSKFLENSYDKNKNIKILKKIEENLKRALELNPEDYITVLKDKDYDFSSIQKEPFFIKIIDDAAREYHKCNSYKITKGN